MKTRTCLVLAGLGAPLVIAGSALAGFTGISTISKPNAFGIRTLNVYAEFDRPGEDVMHLVGGTEQSPLFIEVVDGTFYQHFFNSDTAPLAQLVDAFPELGLDTFVTIGVKSVDPNGAYGGQPENLMFVSPGWPGFGASALVTDWGFWAVVPPNAQADPFNPDFVAGDGRVLIGQFSTEDGAAIEGTMLLQFVSNGVTVVETVSFSHYFCPWDCGNFDGAVGIVDFLAVLAQWGMVGSSCDFDGGGVGITDFLDLLAHKGPCPGP